MAEYTYDYGKRTIIKDGVVYLSTDLYGRINLPITLVKPELRYKKGTVELQGDKVIIKYSKNNPDNLNKRRVTIPTAIRCVLKLQRDDYFKVARNKDGTIFTLTIATDELRQTRSLSEKGYNEIVQLLNKYGINTDEY